MKQKRLKNKECLRVGGEQNTLFEIITKQYLGRFMTLGGRGGSQRTLLKIVVKQYLGILGGGLYFDAFLAFILTLYFDA